MSLALAWARRGLDGGALPVWDTPGSLRFLKTPCLWRVTPDTRRGGGGGLSAPLLTAMVSCHTAHTSIFYLLLENRSLWQNVRQQQAILLWRGGGGGVLQFTEARFGGLVVIVSEELWRDGPPEQRRPAWFREATVEGMPVLQKDEGWRAVITHKEQNKLTYIWPYIYSEQDVTCLSLLPVIPPSTRCFPPMTC